MFGNKRRPEIPVKKEDLKQAIIAANDRLKLQKKKLESQVADAKAELKSIKSDIKVVQKESDSKHSNLDSIKSEINSNIKIANKNRRDLEVSQERLSRSLDEERCVEMNIEKLIKNESKMKKSLDALNKERLGYTDLKGSIKAAKDEYANIKHDIKVLQGEIESARTDAVATKSARDSLEAEFKAFKKDIEIKQEEISKSIAAQDAERIAKESAHNQHMKLLDNTMTEKKDESEVYEALAKKAQADYISIQSQILSAERRLEKAQQDSDGIVKRQKESIAKIKEQYNNWKLNELDKVARLHLKGKIENIDKAGLREILGE
tara:strand:+ start:3028 stop:3987 length:960 start_codon:yes stop_codon:yes gene_type:complete